MPRIAPLAAALLLAAAARAQDPPPAYARLQFLLGKWIGAGGEKDTPSGAGQGAFSFDLQLNKKIIVRRNNATYDSGLTHDDLMVIYLESANDPPRAIYFDTEGHVIHYAASFPAADKVVFESGKGQPGPAYRLTYWIERGVLNGRFEVRPPGGEYKAYLNWTARRRS